MKLRWGIYYKIRYTGSPGKKATNLPAEGRCTNKIVLLRLLMAEIVNFQRLKKKFFRLTPL